MTRRDLLRWGGASSLLYRTGRIAAAERLKVVVTGGHPGDPECGCGGTIAKLTRAGHDVVLLYLNRGEGYCGGEDLARCGTIRTAEAGQACRILRASPVFADQVDGRSVLDNAHYDTFATLLAAQKADLIFTHWPIDKHRDHRAVSQLVLDAWLKGGKRAGLYYYEVADDTMMFTPAEYVDISDPQIQELRRKACYAHRSQKPDQWFPHQMEITRSRGTDSGHQQAEAFLRHWQSPAFVLP